MWLFTKYGFYSVVCARQDNGGHSRPVDHERLMVRARLHGHLDSLKQRFASLLGDCEIREFPGADYAHRIFVAKDAWSQVIQQLNDELDYDNFKSAVATHQGAEGADYERALHHVWSVMLRLQQGEEP